MSRTIKFRAWDKKQKKMLYDVSIGTIKVWDENAPLISHEFSYSEDCVFEQYTGLKDKNGKEIYEGDIIEETVIIEGDAEEYRRYRVYWEDTRLCWCVMDHTWFRDELWETNASREVIGNVHENSKLIGGEE